MCEKNKYEALLDQALQTMEFQLVKHRNGWGVKDIQDNNLSGIEGERFHSAWELLDRLETYLTDYFVSEVEELVAGGSDMDWEDLLEEARSSFSHKQLELCGYDLDVMDMVCFHASEIDLKNCRYTDWGRT